MGFSVLIRVKWPSRFPRVKCQLLDAFEHEGLDKIMAWYFTYALGLRSVDQFLEVFVFEYFLKEHLFNTAALRIVQSNHRLGDLSCERILDVDFFNAFRHTCIVWKTFNAEVRLHTDVRGLTVFTPVFDTDVGLLVADEDRDL